MPSKGYLLKSLTKARTIIKDFKPDLVIGTGGYASLPLLFSAGQKGIPYYLQEQNGYAGLSNKFLAKKAKKVFVAYPNMEQFFPANKVVFSGNPLRNSRLVLGNKVEAQQKLGLNPELKTIFVTGGSLGAKTLNDSILQNLSLIKEHQIQVIWQCGSRYYTSLQSDAKLQNPLIQLKGFIEDMSVCYSAADLVVARSGAITVSELMLMGKACILVPSPNVTDNHQYKNAKAVEMENAAWLVEDHKAVSELMPLAADLLQNEKEIAQKAQNMAKLAKPNAATDIVELIIKEGKWN
jgi:UDP-N-acetylglucosamine--N-acetylmuramyl-(pentapeptide) pyrophosphoryl-undecaprenol N-acetylglucosamine transferase